MDQSVVAGIGNVYRAELLFRARLDPYRPGRRRSPLTLGNRSGTTLERSCAPASAAGRIITTEPRDREHHGRVVRASDAHYVYGRTGRWCRRCHGERSRYRPGRAHSLLVSHVPAVSGG